VRRLKYDASIVEFSACAASHSTGAFSAIERRHTEGGFMPRADGMMENNIHFRRPPFLATASVVKASLVSMLRFSTGQHKGRCPTFSRQQVWKEK
jgi:hypothetical protein